MGMGKNIIAGMEGLASQISRAGTKGKMLSMGTSPAKDFDPFKKPTSPVTIKPVADTTKK